MTSTEQILDTDVRITGNLKVHNSIEGTASRSKWIVLYGAVIDVPAAQLNNVLAGQQIARTTDQLIAALEAGGFNAGFFNVNEGLTGTLTLPNSQITLQALANTITLVRSDVALRH